MRLRPQFFRLLSVTDIHMIIQIVGSAPGFPHGIIDPIEELGQFIKLWYLSPCRPLPGWLCIAFCP
ncbi:Sphingosine-1-phosphate lyase [Arachis hypogaea]|nr:Sphingosine-1-phosphate lyase [Arachis hypogaea]